MKTKLLIATMFFGITTLFAQNIPSYVPTNGLVGWWPFNGNANDESGNGNNGTVNGAKLTSDRNGKANTAYNFNDLNNYVSILNSNKLNFNFQFSISLWFYRNPSTNNDRILSIEKAGASDSYQFRFAIDVNTIDNNKLYFMGAEGLVSTGWSNTNGYSLRTMKNVSASNWHNVVLTRNNNDYILYLDGLQQSISKTSQILNFISNKNNIILGAVLSNNQYVDFFNGKMDDFGIWNRVLTQQEITLLYLGCTKETASSNSFSSPLYTTSSTVSLSALPSGGIFTGDAITANTFDPSKAKLGKNTIKYNFKNTTGCSDSTNFSLIVADTLGNTCSTYDTLKIKVKLTTGIKAGQYNAMNVYPNPTSDVLVIETNDVNGLKGYTYKIVDLQGKEVYKSLITASKTEIALKSIGSKGIYILHIIDEVGQSIENKKIILE